ncbi:MAG: response regulator transcription factor [Thermoleophilia bacterium]|nr:response regulator transcription factor [Thermoleophilia bacterium]
MSADTRATSGAPARTAASVDQVRVLLADDNARFRELLRRLLERENGIHVVAEADNGAHALELAVEYEPDVVLMDLSMPGVDGLEATLNLKRRLPNVTVLMLSVADKEHEIAAGLAGGASEFLIKGTPASEIVAAIRRHTPEVA